MRFVQVAPFTYKVKFRIVRVGIASECKCGNIPKSIAHTPYALICERGAFINTRLHPSTSIHSTSTTSTNTNTRALPFSQKQANGHVRSAFLRTSSIKC
jgi:hypothetical protein